MARSGELLAGSRPVHVGCKPGAGLVTEVDVQLERSLRSSLLSLLPGSSLYGEEEGGTVGPWTWWLDPLDGTTNFVHGWPRSAVSLGLYREDVPVLALTHDPYQHESFWAIRGEGAFLNGRPVRCRAVAAVEDALLAAGFGPEPAGQWDLFRALHGRAHGVRMSGCASLDCAYVACGRADAYWEIDLKPWDVAAGLLLVTEGGGRALDLRGGAADLHSADYLFTAPGIADELLSEVRRWLWAPATAEKNTGGILP